MKRYNPKEIEPKWQAKWEADKIYQATEDPTKPKKYILEYFPYPSGAAMHVGHVRNYTIGDAISRHARMKGYNVLHPMGWDAFGLPAENYAIKTGISPQQAIEENTSKFKQQLTQMGFSYDWSREFASSDPAYYKWTQWFFLLLMKRGLAYRQESLQWWCPVDKTVLANEQVENGHCWRCGSEVEKKSLKQWFFKITDYADRLEKDLDEVNWSESIKSMQRNWIGRSTGAEVIFSVADSSDKLTVFTTRADTLYGATFLVLAPEHPLVGSITPATHKEQVEHYQAKARAKSDIERQETDREKTGVFTGAFAVNPVNEEKIPIWIADYVLGGYGTGAIMAVPAHDERDFEFAKTFELAIRSVVAPVYGEPHEDAEPIDGCTIIVYDRSADTFMGLDWKGGWTGLVAGGINQDETYETCARRELLEEAGIDKTEALIQLGGPVFGHYKHRVKPGYRRARTQGYLAIIDGKPSGETHREAHEQFELNWYSSHELQEKIDSLSSAEHWGEVLRRGIAVAGKYPETKEYELAEATPIKGIVVNSGAYDGLPSAKASEEIVADLAKNEHARQKINYRMRDWLISRQRYWGAPIPVIHCKEHGAVPVPEDRLPVVLPAMESYEPSGDGRSPLATVPEFVNTTCPICNEPAERETDTMDGFACSSWYFLRFADPHDADQPFDKEKVKFWLAVDDYIGGAEHAVMHLLYARMWTKVMQDEGLIDFGEPFKTLRNQGMILAPDGQKMSKSKGNVIAPDELINQGYGADATRVMELFIGPWNQSAAWSVEGMGGSYRFLQRIWTLVQEFLEAGNGASAENPELQRIKHYTTKRVSEDLETLSFNTAIAAMMEGVNSLYKQKQAVPYAEAYDTWKETLETFVQLLAPFAPHISEELWQHLGHEESVHTTNWPTYDDEILKSDTMIVVVQVNGKLRSQLEVDNASDEAAIIKLARADTKVAALLGDRSVIKTIYVPGKLVNFVVK